MADKADVDGLCHQCFLLTFVAMHSLVSGLQVS